MAAPDNARVPFVVTSLDGRRSVFVLEYWPDGATYTLRGLRSPGGTPSLFTVGLRWGLDSYTAASYGLPTSEPDRLHQLIDLTVGAALDDPDFSLEAKSDGRKVNFSPGLDSFLARREPEAPSPEAAARYIGAKMYWGWSFGLSAVSLGAADALRLGTRGEEEVRRLAMIGEGAYWDPVDSPTSASLYRPSGRLLREFQSGSFPGLVLTPVAQVGRLLDAPRYSGARVAFEKAANFLAGDPQDLENAVKEAASAVESLGRVVLDLDGKVTLGGVGEELRGRGVLDRPLDKAVDALSGFRGGEPGVGHGGASEPDVTPHEAQFAINLAASLALLLLDLDRQ